MITVKTLSFDLVAGSSCNMGESHQRRISRPTARAMCGMYPLPDMGAETVVAIGKDLNRSRLYVQNISGHFYLACPHASVPKWPEVFGVTVAA